MKIARLRQPALSAVAVLLISGAGIAFAGNAPSPAAPAAVQAAPAAVEATTPAVEPVEPAGTEKAGAEAAGTEKAGAEATGTEEPGDANLPGGGHADDPNDANADHQFEGVE